MIYENLIYDRNTSVVFCKTKEKFGGLSNMSAGFPLEINNISIKTSEALYQSCRFPHLPNIQEEIILSSNPIAAKMISRSYESETRSDWLDIRIEIMFWCIKVKLLQNWNSFGDLLLSTNDLIIVEQSKNDDFWGAKYQDSFTLKGRNILGWLLTELREMLKNNPDSLKEVEPLNIIDFRLLNENIPIIKK